MLVLDIMNRMSKRLLNRSASVKTDTVKPGDRGPEVENVDSGGGKVTVEVCTPFTDAGSAVDDAFAAVNLVEMEIGMDGVVTVVNTTALLKEKVMLLLTRMWLLCV